MPRQRLRRVSMTTFPSNFRGNPVTLIDGRVVDSYSEEWRAECEARAILAMPLPKRRAFLFGKFDHYGKLTGGLQQKRSPEAFKAILELITRIHQNSRSLSNSEE